MSETTEMTATETQDPNVLGQAEPEEVEKVRVLKSEVAQLLAECGRKDVDISRLKVRTAETEGVVASLENQKVAMIKSIETMEVAGQEVLEGIAARFGIPSGQPWQYLDDGTVRKVDPEMLKAAEAARVAQAGQTNEVPAEGTPQE